MSVLLPGLLAASFHRILQHPSSLIKPLLSWKFSQKHHLLLLRLRRAALPLSVSSPRGKDITEILLS